MAYKRGPGCPFRVILLWGPRGGEDISEVCKFLLAAFFLSPALLFLHYIFSLFRTFPYLIELPYMRVFFY